MNESVCPKCESPNATLQFKQLESWHRTVYPTAAGPDQEGEYDRIVRIPRTAKCTNCGARVPNPFYTNTRHYPV